MATSGVVFGAVEEGAGEAEEGVGVAEDEDMVG